MKKLMVIFDKRNKILCGIFLIILGFILLLENYGIHIISIKRDWPIILIAWGILKLIDVVRK
jgi:hypothetical protein